VVGPRGLGPLKGLLLGSVSEKVLQLAKTPVLVAR
jgi:nucleotide-binding universal stress UspA family protein